MRLNIFKLLAENVDIKPVLHEIEKQPDLWNRIIDPYTQNGRPHKEDRTIWIRYNDEKNLKEPRKFHTPHFPVWYKAWYDLPSLKPIVFGLMNKLEGEMLGAIYIMSLPPGKKVTPHVDKGWHVEYYDNFYVQLEGDENQYFWAGAKEEDAEKIIAKPGDLYTFDNRCVHGITNNSDKVPRTCMLISIRNRFFGKEKNEYNKV
jgi:hypothetical protein